MIARTDSKLHTVADACKGINPKIEVQILARNFSKNKDMQFYEEVRTEVGDKHIGLLVVNAGIYHPGKFWQIDAETHEAMLDCNVYQYAAFLNLFMPQMIARGKKFGVITNSSLSGNATNPYNTTYSATKAFVNQLTKGIQQENKFNDYDVLLLTPGLTLTRMPRGLDFMKSADSPAKCAEGALRDLGQDNETAATVNADLSGMAISLANFFVPSALLNHIYAKVFEYHATYF